MAELLRAGVFDGDALTVTGKTQAQNLEGCEASDRDVIFAFDQPLCEGAGFVVLKGNLFDFAIMKTSVISPDFRRRYLSQPGAENRFEARSCSTGRTTITNGSTTRISGSTSIASSSFAAPAR